MTLKSPWHSIQALRRRHDQLYGGRSYASKVLGYGPLAYWPLWETAGVTAHCLVNPAQDGTYSSDVATWPVGPGIGDGNTAPQYDGANDYVDVFTPALAAAMNYSEYTWMFWAKAESAIRWTDATRRLIQFYDDDNNFSQLVSYANPNLQWRHKGGGTEDNVTAIEASIAWCQFAMTASIATDELKAFRDAAQVGATQNTLGTIVGPIVVAYIGHPPVVTSSWYGSLAHCAIWDRILTQTEIADLYKV